jgi:hypothetical protein
LTVGEASAVAVLGGGRRSGGSDESKRVREKNEGRESGDGGSGEAGPRGGRPCGDELSRAELRSSI